MASTHKTFADGEILTATDVNNALNPGVADHVPYATAAGKTTITTTAANPYTTTIALPAGRFAVAPIITVGLSDVPAGSPNCTVRAYGANTAQFTIAVYTVNGAPAAFTCTIDWMAIQQKTAAAAG